MFVSLLALIAAGLWIFGFIGLARIMLAALAGRPGSDPTKSDLWGVTAACFAGGVVMIIILALLGFFSGK